MEYILPKILHVTMLSVGIFVTPERSPWDRIVCLWEEKVSKPRVSMALRVQQTVTVHRTPNPEGTTLTTGPAPPGLGLALGLGLRLGVGGWGRGRGWNIGRAVDLGARICSVRSTWSRSLGSSTISDQNRIEGLGPRPRNLRPQMTSLVPLHLLIVDFEISRPTLQEEDEEEEVVIVSSSQEPNSITLANPKSDRGEFLFVFSSCSKGQGFFYVWEMLRWSTHACMANLRVTRMKESG